MFMNSFKIPKQVTIADNFCSTHIFYNYLSCSNVQILCMYICHMKIENDLCTVPGHIVLWPLNKRFPICCRHHRHISNLLCTVCLSHSNASVKPCVKSILYELLNPTVSQSSIVSAVARVNDGDKSRWLRMAVKTTEQNLIYFSWNT